MNNNRVAPLDGVRNFRDFGGYRAKGGQVRWGRLFRSAHFAEASDADAAYLQGLGVRAIIDLRRPQERKAQPSRWPNEPGAHLIVDDEGADDLTEPPHLAFLRQPDLSAASVDRYMMDLYRAVPFEGRHIRLYRALFAALAKGDGGAVVHCAAGKDRTGIACALVLNVLGVDHDDIMDDYLLTNHAVDLDGRGAKIKQMIELHLGRSLDLEAVKPMLGVRAEFLEAALEEIGDQGRYVSDVLGVNDAQKDQIRANLIA